MPATYVTAATLKASLGVGTLYDSYTWIEDTCQAAQDLINGFLWFDSAPVVGTALVSNVATVMVANPGIFTTGQSVTVAGAGSTFNGTFTITGTIPFSTGTANILPAFNMQLNYWQFPQGYSFIQYAKTASDQNFRRVLPYGTMTGDDTKTATYANTPAINAAALMLAENIWTSRFSTQNGGTSLDGYSPSPFKMSNTLMASVRGLLANYLSPAGMVGQMPAAITTLRTTIATALANPGVWTVFNYPPSTMQSSAIVVSPADPYITPSNNSQAGIAPMANFRIIMTVPMFDNASNLIGIEDTIVAVFNKLASSSIVFNVSAVSAPSVLSVASGDYLTADLQLSVLTSWS